MTKFAYYRDDGILEKLLERSVLNLQRIWNGRKRFDNSLGRPQIGLTANLGFAIDSLRDNGIIRSTLIFFKTQL